MPNILSLPFFAAMLAASFVSMTTALSLGGRSEIELLPPHMHRRTRSAIRRLVTGFSSAATSSTSVRTDSPSRTLNPVAYGGVNDCSADSFPAFNALTAALVNFTVGTLSDGIKDLGGVVIDLQGGCYLLSSSWMIPQFYANFHITHGEIRAHPTFPINATLVQVGNTPCTTPSGQGSCNQNAGFHGVTFDGAHIAGTLLTIAATMGAVVDGSSVFLNFNINGILVAGGHETMVSDSWIAAYPWNSPNRTDVTGSTGIWLAGNDHYIQNVIVYSSQFGAKVTGSANIITGLHTWNLNTGQNGVGILNTASQNRFVSCYLDGNDIIFEGDGAQQTIIVDSFFLLGGQLVFKAQPNYQQVYGVSVQDNEWFASSSPPLSVDESFAPWTSVTDLTFTGATLQQGQPWVGLTASQIQQGTPGSRSILTYNFTSQLLFPSIPIASAFATFYQADGGAETPPAVGVNISATGQLVTGYIGSFSGAYSVRVVVDQSQHTSGS